MDPPKKDDDDDNNNNTPGLIGTYLALTSPNPTLPFVGAGRVFPFHSPWSGALKELLPARASVFCCCRQLRHGCFSILGEAMTQRLRVAILTSMFRQEGDLIGSGRHFQSGDARGKRPVWAGGDWTS